jgi:hypothetical protein
MRRGRRAFINLTAAQADDRIEAVSPERDREQIGKVDVRRASTAAAPLGGLAPIEGAAESDARADRDQQ